MAQIDDLTRIPAGSSVDHPEGRKGKHDWRLGRFAGLPDAKPDHLSRIPKAQRSQDMIEVDPVRKVCIRFKRILKFLLRKNCDLKQFIVVGFEVQKLPHDLEAKIGDFLAFVDNQDNDLVFIDAFVENVFFDNFLKLPVVGIRRRL